MIRSIALTSRARSAALGLALVGLANCSTDATEADPSSTPITRPSPEASTSSAAPTTRIATATTTIIDTSTSAFTNTATSGPAPPTDTESTEVGSASKSLPNPGSVEAGTYTLAAVQPPAVIELGDGWWAGWDYGDNLPMPDGVVALEHRLSSGFVRLAFWDTTDLMIGGSQRPDLRRYVRELPTITGLTEQATDIGGVDATRLDFGWTGGFAQIIRIPPTAFVLASDEPQHWTVIDTTDGQLLINWTVENAAGSDLETEAEALILPVLTSFRF
jgi:hypothetical protein